MKSNESMNYFLSSYSKLITNNTFWISGPARSGTSLLGKLLELNAEQQQTTDDIQGRLLLDESGLEIVPVLTPTQQALFDKLPDIVNQYEELFNKKDELVKDIITKKLLQI